VSSCGVCLLVSLSSFVTVVVDEKAVLSLFSKHDGSVPTWMLRFACLIVGLSLAMSAVKGLEYFALAGALFAVSVVFGLLAMKAEQLKWLALAYQLGISWAAGLYDPPLLALAVAVSALSAGLAWAFAAPSGPAKAAWEDEAYKGCASYSPAKGSTFLLILCLGSLLEHLSSNEDQSLRLMQPLWERLVAAGMPYVTHRFFPGAVATASYFISCAYFTFLDVTKSSTKVQKDYWPDANVMWAAAWPQILAYGGGQVIMWSTWAADREGNSVELPLLAPSLLEFSWHLALCLVVGDFLIYWEHRIMHMIPFTRKHIHSVHHEYTAVFSWAGGWVHPLEDAIVVLCQAITPVLLAVHPLTFWIFAFVWVLCLIDEHSGHDVWWSPYQLLPFNNRPLGGGAAPHDIHHYQVTKNFGFVFCAWDHLFGTFEAVVPEPKNPYVPPYKREFRRNAFSKTD